MWNTNSPIPLGPGPRPSSFSSPLRPAPRWQTTAKTGSPTLRSGSTAKSAAPGAPRRFRRRRGGSPPPGGESGATQYGLLVTVAVSGEGCLINNQPASELRLRDLELGGSCSVTVRIGNKKDAPNMWAASTCSAKSSAILSRTSSSRLFIDPSFPCRAAKPEMQQKAPAQK